MRRIGYCIRAALIMSLAACEAQQSANEVQQPAQAANVAQPAAKVAAAKVAAAKCPDLSTILPNNVPDLTRKVYACVERNALLYAKGPDSPEALSKAVLAKCKATIIQYVDQEAKKAGVKPPYTTAFESWQDHTLPIIAEARARRGCYS
jgi:hypothetical protein